MFQRSLTVAGVIAIVPFGLQAAGHSEQVEELFSVMQMPEILEIMREEGLDYGQTIGNDLFPGRSNDDWSQVVGRIYDQDRMKAELITSLAAELDGDDVASMVSFFGGEIGEKIIELEVAARRAFLDDDLEAAANEVAALAMADQTDRYKQVETFVEVNDLVETNIVGAMNSNFAFYTGLVNGGGMSGEVSEEQILQDVWSQEPEIRQSTTEWVFSFLLLAYEPLDSDELDTYIAFSEGDAGQDLNSALFVAFDNVFERISHNLGTASAQFMAQQEL